jgi:hypothetical protein
VTVPGHDARSTKCTPQDDLELRIFGHHLPVGTRKPILGGVERTVQERAQVVQAFRTQLQLLALEKRLDVSPGEQMQLQVCEISAEQVALHGRFVSAMRWSAFRVRGEPPVQQLADGHVAVWNRIEAEALAIDLPRHLAL